MRANACFATQLEKWAKEDRQLSKAEIEERRVQRLRAVEKEMLESMWYAVGWDDQIKCWAEKLSTFEAGQDRNEHLQWLFRYGLGEGEDGGNVIFYSFCQGEWASSEETAHCWVCGKCESPSRIWHCGVCNKCRDEDDEPCVGCGGMSKLQAGAEAEESDGSYDSNEGDLDEEP